MKLGTTSHPKFRRLMKMLGQTQYATVGVLESLWAMAAQFTDDGDLSRFEPDDIASYIDWEGDAQELIDALVKCRWLDKTHDGLVVHDWADHMPYFITERIKKRNQRSTKSKPVPGQSRDIPGTSQECLGNSDLAQPSAEESSPAKSSGGRNARAQNSYRLARDIPADDFHTEWLQWCNYVLANTGKELDAVTGEIEIMRLTGLGIEKAKRDIVFSIRKQAKSLLDSDNDYERNGVRSSNSKEGKRVLA